MLYGAHKAMMEQWLATLSRRGELSALSLRLPGVVARPAGPSGMKSVFISEVFHAIAARRPIEVPVSNEATMWLMSVGQIVRCLARGLEVAAGKLPASRAVTLPAVRASMGELVAEICHQCSVVTELVSYVPDTTLELGFGRQSPLATRAADTLGFKSDGTLAELVRSTLATL